MELPRPILELGVVIPGMLLACFPAKSSLKQPLSKLILWLVPLLALLCAAGGVVCYARRMPTEIGRASCRERCRSRWSPYH